MALTSKDVGPFVMSRKNPLAPSMLCVHSLPDPDRAAIEVLYEHGDATAVEVGRSLGVSASAVRPRFARLGTQGYVASSLKSSGRRGRPGYRYRLTRSGRRLFSHRLDLAAAARDRAMLEEIRCRYPDLMAAVLRDPVRPAAKEAPNSRNGQDL